MSEEYPDSKDAKLIEAFTKLNSKKEVVKFLRDLLTISEIKEASNRFHIATLLWKGGLSYIQIAEKANTSTSTVTRVAEWLFKKGLNGYKTVLKRMYPKPSKRSSSPRQRIS